MKIEQYFKSIEKGVREVYEVAEEARTKGLDPVEKVEIPLAMNMAEKVVGLISTIYPQMEGSGIAKRIAELEKQYGKLDTTVVFKIAEEIAKQKFCKFENLLQAIDAGIRIGFAYATLGVVSSPIEGFTGLKLGKTREGKEYFVASFSGPIRSAGTTASCIVLILIDYLREMFGYAKYDPREEEVKRVVTELTDFHDRITNLQYMPTVEELTFIAENMPFQVAGDASEKLEVSNYKNLERVDTNRLRSGVCLIMGEGLAQKAAKGFRLLNQARANGVECTGFDFLKDYIELHEKRAKGKTDSSPTYIKDLVAGRPVFGHPSRSGSFRFRYGRGRVSGFSAFSVHPATMAITDDFIAIGTQLKIEKPTKGAAITVCDKVEGPIVKLFNGSVKKIQSKEEAKKLYPDVEEIIYLGDMLFPFSDILNRNADFIKPGYVEEWWGLELREKDKELEKEIDCFEIGFERACEISKEHGIALNPKFIFYWSQISEEQFVGLMKWLKHARVNNKIIFPFNKADQEEFEMGKRALELLGVPHEMTIENVVVDELNSKSLFVNLGLGLSVLEKDNFLLKDIINVDDFDLKVTPQACPDKSQKEISTGGKEVLDIINFVSDFKIKDKAGDFVGARMGRPEKAKLRKLQGSPNVLFPVGNEGGRLRSIQAAVEEGHVKSSFPLYFCEKCDKETIYPTCETCESKCKKKYYFYETKEKSFSKISQIQEKEGQPYCYQDLDMPHYYNKAISKLGMEKSEVPLLIKGLRGTSSAEHAMENLSKGILRAQHGLQVNKDGTIRFDATELPLVSFKPKEIGVSVEKIRELGYTEDVYGKELVEDNQILELMPHDVLLPSYVGSLDERADDTFVNVCNFVDAELEKFYGLKKFYNVKNRDDLVGKLGVCMAPHNCAGVICRFIGFTNTLGLFASPYMHAAIRRDCFEYNTYISIKENGFWKNIKIGDLVEKLKPQEVVDSFGTKEIKVSDFETIGYDKKLENVKINNFTKHTKNNMFEIKTSLGKKLSVTENHKFLVDNKIKRASDLKVGDKVPLPRKIEIESKNLKSINLLEYLKDENLMVRGINDILVNLDSSKKENILNKLKISKRQFMNYKIRDSYPSNFVLELNSNLKKEIFRVGKIAVKRDHVEVPIIINLEKDLLEVIGLYIAEGYSRSISGKKGLNQVYISSNDVVLRNFVKKTIKKHLGLNPSEKKDDRVTFSSKVLYLFFTKILMCGSVAKDKRIPYLFLNLPLDKLACVLRGYFEGDGSVSRGDKRVCCDTVSEGLLFDLEFCLTRFNIFAKRYEYEKEPGPKVKSFYERKKRDIPIFKITKLVIGSDFVGFFKKIGFLSLRKKNIFNYLLKKNHYGMRINYDENFVYDPIVSIKKIGKKESYCLNVNSGNHLVVANSILTKNCDGDEAALMLLGDVLLNFSRKFLPSHRGGTQDAPLVLNAKIDAGEVDDQILDFEYCWEYPLELYQAAEKREHSSKIHINTVRDILKRDENPFVGVGFTHDTTNFNEGVPCSAYKLLATMQEKVQHQMELVEKLRAVDTSDAARLIIERHFIRDMMGNLRKFSMQEFRCVGCNEIVRRPPLSGVCPKCRGKLIFTIHEGGIKKYLEPALDLARKYNLSPYLQQRLVLLKGYIDSIFGKELEKQKTINEWFG